MTTTTNYENGETSVGEAKIACLEFRAFLTSYMKSPVRLSETHHVDKSMALL